MSTATKSKPKGIPTRDSIEEKYKWNLKDLYLSDDAWEKDIEKVNQLIEKSKEYSGKLASSSAIMYACFETRNELNIIIAKLFQYARLNQDRDNRVSKYQAMTERASILVSNAGAAFAFVEPELLKIEENILKELACQFPKTDVYDLYIQELIRSRKHIRSGEVEELLAMSATVARGAESIFTMLDDADIKYKPIIDENGNEIELTKQRVAKCLDSSDGRVRRDAFNSLYSAYKEHVNTLSASLGTSVNKDIFYTKARRFDNCLSSSLFGDNIPTSVYHSLLDTTEAHLEGLNKYTAVRKRILKLDEIHTYDLMCPLFPDNDYEVPYSQAVENTLRAVKPLGEKYYTALKTAFDSHKCTSIGSRSGLF